MARGLCSGKKKKKKRFLFFVTMYIIIFLLFLQEQKRIAKPPPDLYPFSNNHAAGVLLSTCYKQKLKEEMFLNLWKAIFSSYNKPEQDILPHTQYVLEG